MMPPSLPLLFASVALVHALKPTDLSGPPSDPCSSSPCVRGACGRSTAHYSLAQYLCECPVGYTGVHCEIQSLVAPCFSSNMVLQSGNEQTSIYGDANATVAGDTITVVVSPASAVGGRGPFTATAASDGSWIVALGKMEVSTAPLALHVSSKRGAKQTLTNILVGSVFVCSGQSNMALPVSGGYLPLSAEEVYAQAKQFPHIRLLNNGHFWPPTPSHPGGTALGKQLGDAPGWQIPSYGNGTSASPGTVANFSAVCWFMGATLSAHAPSVPIGLISTDAGGTSIHRWVSQKAAAVCSQITPTSTQSMGPDIGTLFVPMVLPLAKMAVSGFTWYQGEANECPSVLGPDGTVRMGGPCGGEYYACQLRALIEDWRAEFVNSPPDAPFLVNELGGLQDTQWPVLRQAMHQAVLNLTKTTVIANSDMGDDSGRIRNGLPSGAMHSRRKINLGRRNGLAMIALMGGDLASFAPQTGATGPILESAAIVATTGVAGDGVHNEFHIEIVFTQETANLLHFAGAADCTICCETANGSAIQLRVENATSPTGYTWQRSALPTVSGNTVHAIFTPSPSDAKVSTNLLRFMFEGEPECVLYNGVGGPDNSSAIAATPFFVSLESSGAGKASLPTLVPATPCASMLSNGSCYFLPAPCSSFTDILPNGTHVAGGCPTDRCCWDPATNKGQCEDKGLPGCDGL